MFSSVYNAQAELQIARAQPEPKYSSEHYLARSLSTDSPQVERFGSIRDKQMWPNNSMHAFVKLKNRSITLYINSYDICFTNMFLNFPGWIL